MYHRWAAPLSVKNFFKNLKFNYKRGGSLKGGLARLVHNCSNLIEFKRGVLDPFFISGLVDGEGS